jgi:hypothetical protein
MHFKRSIGSNALLFQILLGVSEEIEDFKFIKRDNLLTSHGHIKFVFMFLIK